MTARTGDDETRPTAAARGGGQNPAAPPDGGERQPSAQQDRYHRLVVLIPEVQPARPWQRVLHNQRGFVLDRAIQRGTVNVVICRLHFKLSAVARPPNPG